MKLTRQQKNKQLNRNIAGATVWFMLTGAYAIYFHFYRVGIIASCVLVFLYFLIATVCVSNIKSTVDKTEERNRRNKKYQTRLLVCSLVCILIISMSSQIYWLKKEQIQEEYLQEIEGKTNFLLEHIDIP